MIDDTDEGFDNFLKALDVQERARSARLEAQRLKRRRRVVTVYILLGMLVSALVLVEALIVFVRGVS